ncbi:MAG: hypothetical protein WCT04_22745, partial [Planctomycetota bacterium]
MRYSRSILFVLAATFMSAQLLALDIGHNDSTKQTVFTTPDDAFKALIDGMERNSDDQLLNV